MMRQKRECRDLICKESGAIVDLEMRGFEPLTSYMRISRETLMKSWFARQRRRLSVAECCRKLLVLRRDCRTNAVRLDATGLRREGGLKRAI